MSRKFESDRIDHSCDSFFFQAEDGIRDLTVTGVQTCALPIWGRGTGEVGLFLALFNHGCDVLYLNAFHHVRKCRDCPAEERRLRLLPACNRVLQQRSEERRVGKECRSRWPTHANNKDPSITDR